MCHHTQAQRLQKLVQALELQEKESLMTWRRTQVSTSLSQYAIPQSLN
jgi:hypothetical protein